MIEVFRDDKVLRLVGFKAGLQVEVDYDDVNHLEVYEEVVKIVTLLNAYRF